MKRSNTILYIGIFIMIFSQIVLPANITSVSNVQIIPPNPSPGQTVEIRWNYYVDSQYNNPHFLAVVSNTTTLRPANTSGQWVMIGNGCTTPANPATAQVTGGCNMGNNISPAGTHSSTESGTYTFTLPNDLIPGYTYYVIVGMKDYNVYMNPSVDVSAQNYVAFTIPLPPPTIQLNKVAEGSAAQPGGYVLYTIHYYIANTNNVVITDDIPANVTCVQAYDGGTCGNPITWNIGNVTSPIRGSVSWLGQISGSVSQGTVIHNTASAISNETSAVSNDAIVTIGASLEINKGAVSNAVQVGDTITYVLTYTNSGYALSEYVDFSTPANEPIPGWTEEVTGATWEITNGYLRATGPTGQWGKLIKNTPSLHDAMYITDLYVPASNPSGDAVFIFNFIDQYNQYHARIQTDMPPNGQICFDKVVGTWTSVQCVNATGFSIQNDRWYTMKVVVQGTNIRIKVWPKGNPEPVAWAINLNDNSLTLPGRPGYQDNEGEDRFDNLKIFIPAPATNVVVWDSIPNCTTYLNCYGGTSCSYIGGSPGVVYWNLGNLGYTYGQLTFTVRAESCAGGTYVNNTACIDSTEPAPKVCSNIATVAVGSVATATPTFTNTFTFTPTNTLTLTFTNTITNTRTNTPTNTLTHTATSTSSFTNTFTETVTGTPPPTWTWTNTFTSTNTATNTPTRTDTATATFTFSATGTSSPTNTFTHTNTGTNTGTPTSTYTFTNTNSPTNTFTATSTSTPQPANINVTLEAIDITTTSGGYAKLKITIKNTGSDAFNVILWDSVPSDSSFDSSYQENINWILNGNVFYLNISQLAQGETKTFYFNIKTNEGLPTGHIIFISPVTVSYTDILNPIAYAMSNPAFISVGDIVVYPNPFNPEIAVGKKLKFANVPRNAKIMIYTISGELVKSFNAQTAYVFWDGTNAMNELVSPGIYYYLITWQDGKKIIKGKIFVIKQ